MKPCRPRKALALRTAWCSILDETIRFPSSGGSIAQLLDSISSWVMERPSTEPIITRSTCPRADSMAPLDQCANPFMNDGFQNRYLNKRKHGFRYFWFVWSRRSLTRIDQFSRSHSIWISAPTCTSIREELSSQRGRKRDGGDDDGRSVRRSELHPIKILIPSDKAEPNLVLSCRQSEGDRDRIKDR